MKTLTGDYECTTSNKGNPFDGQNTAVCFAYQIDEETPRAVDIKTAIGTLSSLSSSILHIFFNAKFDIHWHRKCGYNAIHHVWCVQLAEFYLSGQRLPYPSLEDTAHKYNLGAKLDVVKLEYWDKGINTDQIPQEILYNYACQDVSLTYQIYLKQVEQFKQNPKLYALFKIACQDLLILEEMEWNGLRYSKDLCLSRADEVRSKLDAIDVELCKLYPDLVINFNSGDQLSAFLYGGTIYSIRREPVGVYKTGPRVGQPRFRLVESVDTLPRLIEPLPRSELQKEGYYRTDEGTLRKLKGKAAKKYVPLLLERSKLEKLLGTYYEGIPDLAEKMNWEPGYIHGQFNQVVAATGRLSSSKPNLQNFAGAIEDIFITRFDYEETPGSIESPTRGE